MVSWIRGLDGAVGPGPTGPWPVRVAILTSAAYPVQTAFFCPWIAFPVTQSTILRTLSRCHRGQRPFILPASRTGRIPASCNYAGDPTLGWPATSTAASTRNGDPCGCLLRTAGRPERGVAGTGGTAQPAMHAALADAYLCVPPCSPI
jgi:hypothetical protein